MTATSTPASNRPAGAIRHGSSIGQPLTRRDGPLKVTGQARFSADNLPPGPSTRRSASPGSPAVASPASMWPPPRPIPASWR